MQIDRSLLSGITSVVCPHTTHTPLNGTCSKILLLYVLRWHCQRSVNSPVDLRHITWPETCHCHSGHEKRQIPWDRWRLRFIRSEVLFHLHIKEEIRTYSCFKDFIYRVASTSQSPLSHLKTSVKIQREFVMWRLVKVTWMFVPVLSFLLFTVAKMLRRTKIFPQLVRSTFTAQNTPAVTRRQETVISKCINCYQTEFLLNILLWSYQVPDR